MQTANPICACGKPTTHRGVCSARWAVRKANNGSSGLKAKAPVEGAAPMSEEAIARRLFGELADDILLLRERGHTVARFKDGFRVDREAITHDQLTAKAKAAREPKAVESRPAHSYPKAIQPVLPDSAVTEPALRARVAHLEQRIEFLFAVVADAISGRREALGGQVKGLSVLETTLRNAA